MNNPTIRTINNLEILLHHFYSPDPHPRRSADAIIEGENHLLLNGMLVKGAALGVWDVTEKGRFFINHLLSIPFPRETWCIPQDES